MNLVINHCYGDKLFKSFDNNIYLESMNKIKNAKKVLFFQNTSYEDIEKVAQYYDIIMEFKPDIHVYLDEIFYEFLSTCSDEYEYVLISDSRDVILQKDPFDYMIENKKNIYMTSEGMKVKDSIPNNNWVFNLLRSQRDFNQQVFENEVLNGGVFGGKAEHIMMLLLMSFTNRNRNSHEPVYNQPVYCFADYYLKMAKFVEICRPSTSLFCITGEGVLRHGVPMKIVDGLACNEDNEPYYIIHQWDRTFFADEVRSRYLEGHSE